MLEREASVSLGNHFPSPKTICLIGLLGGFKESKSIKQTVQAAQNLINLVYVNVVVITACGRQLETTNT